MKSAIYWIATGLVAVVMGMLIPAEGRGGEPLQARMEAGAAGPSVVVSGPEVLAYSLDLAPDGRLTISFSGETVLASTQGIGEQEGLLLTFPEAGTLVLSPVLGLVGIDSSAGEVRFTVQPLIGQIAVDSEYTLGVGDKVRLNIYGDDQFSNKDMRIAGNGTVALPFVGQVSVAGLTVNQGADEMARILSDGYLVDPKVSLEIIEYQSQWVNVSGQINKPGRYYLEGPTRLVQVIAQAGGLGSEAGTSIRITRPGRGGAADENFIVSREDLYRSDDPAANPQIFSGDSVVASSEEYFYIKGEVRAPGRYALDEDTTILKAISIAGGFEQYAHHKKVELLRKEGDETIRLVLNVERIENRKAEDIRLLPGDIINVQARFL